MAIKVGGTSVIDDSRNLQNIASIDATTLAAFTTAGVGDITSVTAGSGLTGGGTSGAVTVNHADTSSQGSVNNSGNTVIQDITLDTYGHITNINSTTVSAGAGIVKAWANFKGTGTVSILNSGNVSSVSDNGTGIYTVNISSAMSTTNYGYALTGQSSESAHLFADVNQRYATNNTTTRLYVGTGENGGANSTGRYRDASKISAWVLE